MPKLKNFTKEVIYNIGDTVDFSWIGQSDRGVIIRINTEGREFPVYHIKSHSSKLIYNMGAEPGVTSAGFIIGITGQVKPAETKLEVTDTIDTESPELKQAVQKQKDFINHFFEL